MVLSSILGGSALGFLGSAVTGVIDYLKQKEQNKHQLAMLQAQKDLVNAQGANAVSLENAKNFGISNENDQATYFKGQIPSGVTGIILSFLMIFVDFLRGFTRPGITWFLIIATTLLGVEALSQTEFTPEFITGISHAVIGMLLDLVSLCVGFWFGGKTVKIK